MKFEKNKDFKIELKSMKKIIPQTTEDCLCSGKLEVKIKCKMSNLQISRQFSTSNCKSISILSMLNHRSFKSPRRSSRSWFKAWLASSLSWLVVPKFSFDHQVNFSRHFRQKLIISSTMFLLHIAISSFMFITMQLKI